MTIVSTTEFANHQAKYLNLALNEEVFIKNGRDTLVVTKVKKNEKKMLKPDDDFRRAISMEEFQHQALLAVDKFR